MADDDVLRPRQGHRVQGRAGDTPSRTGDARAARRAACGPVVVCGPAGYLADMLTFRLVGSGTDVVRLRPRLHDWPPTSGDCATGDGCGPDDGVTLVEHDPDDGDVPVEVAAGASFVVHVTDGPVEDTLAAMSAATLETLCALRIARLNGVRLVIASQPGNLAHLPSDEALAAGYRSSHGVDAVVARVARCYGPGMPEGEGGVVGRLLRDAAAGGPLLVGAADRSRHRLCFVDDAVDGLLAVARDSGEDPVDIGPERDVATVEVAREVARATGVGYVLVEQHRSGALGPVAGSPRATVAVGVPPAGWEPTTSLRDGLLRCAEPSRARAGSTRVTAALLPDDLLQETSGGGAA